MIINIGPLRDNPGTSQKVHFKVAVLEGLDWPKSIKQESQLDIKATVTNTGNSYAVQGKATVDVELQCDRCLTRFTHDLVAPLEEEYVPGIGSDYDHGVDAAESEADAQLAQESVFYGNTIDITEAVREQLLLALPIKLLCNPACQGLCPVCGQELNTKRCDCKQITTDPRWADLSRLLEER